MHASFNPPGACLPFAHVPLLSSDRQFSSASLKLFDPRQAYVRLVAIADRGTERCLARNADTTSEQLLSAPADNIAFQGCTVEIQPQTTRHAKPKRRDRWPNLVNLREGAVQVEWTSLLLFAEVCADLWGIMLESRHH